MISVICVSNNLEVLNKMLKPSLEKQSETYELIVLDNRQNEYSSAAKALNAGAIKAIGEMLVFAHQDISFDSTLLTNIKNDLAHLPLNSIVGLAGVKDKSGVITNLKQGPEKKNGGDILL